SAENCRVGGPAGLMTERRAAAAPPASLRGPDSSHSNTRTGRDRACIELDGQVSRHRNLLPNSLSQRSLACPLYPKSAIESDHRGQTLALLLRRSNSRRKIHRNFQFD